MQQLKLEDILPSKIIGNLVYALTDSDPQFLYNRLKPNIFVVSRSQDNWERQTIKIFRLGSKGEGDGGRISTTSALYLVKLCLL